MVGGFGGCVVVLVVTTFTSVIAEEVFDSISNSTNSTLDVESKQQPNDTVDIRHMLWRKCALQLSPVCLKLTLVLLVDRLSHDTYQPLSGVTLSSNQSSASVESPAASSRGDMTLADRLDEHLRHRVVSYMRSLTLTVKPFDLPLVNGTSLFLAVNDSSTGRKKDSVGAGAVALMMGGAMMTMMMAGLAALAGKAMMTSMMALMLAALSSMKGGGGGGGKSTTYEIIAQPHHSDHGWRRSVDTVLPLRSSSHSPVP
ncbi:uncharacterized protein LOC128994585 [Macrosteles quadrilineatus]|uniref:uncharacterized protein LOC128994585 n=1 Tax=Macrosteles quadrilineatus TaxID=74068 RepID=UPI0023E1C52A|nr:uncharacterized protein LOC128994585 [Macrosteles quadrilineatus]